MNPESILSALEARVLGCLIEKELATPDVYPLTLNALVNACSQKNNRDPVMEVTSRDVELALEGLRNKQLVTHFSGADSRVAKFKQKIDAVYPMSTVERAMFGELLLRGPQTTAGLRGNSERMTAMPSVDEIETLLNELAQRPSGALTRKLARQPGQKEARWTQLLTGEPALVSPATESGTSVSGAGSREPLAVSVSVALPPEAEKRIAALEADVAQLKEELAKLRGALGG